MNDLSFQSSSIEMLAILKLSLHAPWVLKTFLHSHCQYILLKHVLGEPILYAWNELRRD